MLEPTPRYDMGAFQDEGQDPVRKDVLEMLLRLFDREQLALIPALDFSTPLSELEAELRRGAAGRGGRPPVAGGRGDPAFGLRLRPASRARVGNGRRDHRPVPARDA